MIGLLSYDFAGYPDGLFCARDSFAGIGHAWKPEGDFEVKP